MRTAAERGAHMVSNRYARGRRWSPVWSLLSILALVLAACSGSTEELPQTPGDGVQVDMARANWSTGYFQAAIVAELLGELGYEVTDPAQTEMAPDAFFPALAAGEVDVWVNTWIPSHGAFLAESTTGGGTIADRRDGNSSGNGSRGTGSGGHERSILWRHTRPREGPGGAWRLHAVRFVGGPHESRFR